MNLKTAWLLALCMPLVAWSAVERVAPAEEARWVRHLIPLPRQISIDGRVDIAPSDVGITTPSGSPPLVTNAVSRLRALWKDKAGCAPLGDKFDILLGVLPADNRLGSTEVNVRPMLEGLPHRKQAYTIQPQGANRLILTALDGRGVFYAAMTLCQLLEPALKADGVSIPLVTVLDWPDMAERGLWNHRRDLIPWMASYKMNFGKLPTYMQIKRDEPHTVNVDVDAIREARTFALNYLPNITHFNMLGRRGLFDAYPECRGKGDQAVAGHYFAHRRAGKQNRAPCASAPAFTSLLTDWLTDMASKGLREVSLWLSERPCQCQCPRCLKDGQFVWEARAAVRAWQEARKTYPKLVVRLFISTTSNEKYERVIAESPPEVKLERCCAAELDRVIHEPRDLFINPRFDAAAVAGRWVSSYDVPVPANGAVETPEFKVPHRSAHRIRDFVSQLHTRRYSGGYAMTGWHEKAVEICGFNYLALAEWSWNRDGRTEREFAVAWATREGYRDPEKVGEWAELMGPVEFDVYDSDFPTCYSWGKAVDMVKTRRAPVLGQGMFRYYATPEAFERKLKTCDQAMDIARPLDKPDLAHETRVVRSYVDLAKHIYEAAVLAADPDRAPDRNGQSMDKVLQELQRAGAENVAAIRTWRSALGPEPWHRRVHDAIKGTEDTVAGIVEALGTR